MNDEELDAAIAERFKAYEAGMHLPDEFKGRFVSSVRRKRTLRRLWMLGLIGAMALASVVIVNLTKPAVVSSNVKPALMATTDPTNDTVKVSYLILLSYLRECFIRPKSARRKEEE